MAQISGLILGISVWALPLIFAVTLHEAAHGYAARVLGDDTATRLGRVSLNPLRHVDPFGTIILPLLLLAAGGMLFGWAKPVPVNFSRLRPPRLGMVVVAAAGPGINLALAVVSILVLIHGVPLLPVEAGEWLGINLVNSIKINLLLAVFNMIPLPPLDGGRVAVGVLPAPLAWRLARMEKAGMLILLVALFVLPLLGDRLGLDLDIFRWLVGGPVDYLARILVAVFG